MRPTLVKPRRLRRGDRIGVIAPASPITLDSAPIAVGYERLGELGLAVEEAPQCRLVTGHTAGTPQERAAAIHAFLGRPDIAGIMSFWGGFQSHQLLEHLDFDKFRAYPKVLLGYSDLTSLTVGIHAKSGCVTFSGPAVISFVKPTVPTYTIANMEQTLFHGTAPLRLSASSEWSDNKWYDHPERKMLFEPTPPWRTYRCGKVRGPLLAGNLGTMLLLAGTPYWPNLDGVVLIVEDDEAESTKTLDRMFTQARQMGVFDRVAGLAVGRFPRCVGLNERDSLAGLLDIALRGYSFPVLLELDYGHTDPLLTLPLGVSCELDADAGIVTLLESGVT